MDDTFIFWGREENKTSAHRLIIGANVVEKRRLKSFYVCHNSGMELTNNEIGYKQKQ
jgi:hypothetical protein